MRPLIGVLHLGHCGVSGNFIRSSGTKVGRPSELPIQNPTKYYLVINLRTAKAIWLDAPAMLLGRADD
jgi:hypothetical protein